jgi:hypothetical protein
MMNTRFLILLVLFAGSAALATPFAEPTSDPNHALYEAIDRWKTRGLIDRLPVMQPYPRHELVTALESVRSRGTAAERREAESYLEELSPSDSPRLKATPFIETRVWIRDDEVQPKAALGFELAGALTPFLDIGASAGGFAIERGAENLVPYGTRSTDDVLEDNARVTVAGREVYTLLQINTQTALHWDSGFLQAGISRRSYGPFHHDSPVVSRQAPQAGSFALQWDIGPVRYTGALFSHTATQVFREIEDPAADNEDNIDVNQDGEDDFYDKPFDRPGKQLFIHSFGLRPLEWLQFSVFESIVYGPRFEPTYLVPLKFLWHAQGTANFVDNSFIGLAADIAPAPGWRIPLMIYVDDASFNDLARLNFDTKYKMATATAVQWAPEHDWRPLVEVSYETVFPYMYTHAGLDPYTTEPNYNTYLHQRESVGSSLLPNSDRARVAVSGSPLRWLGIEWSGAVMRHANASEGELEQYLNDGKYFDNGREGEFTTDPDDAGEPDDLYWIRGDLTYNGPFRFLTQESIETIYQTGLAFDLRFPVRSTIWSVDLGYTFEYVAGPISYEWSESDDENGGGGRTVVGSDEINHYAEVGLRIRY